jgi:HEPN domain-containing protein
MNALVAEWVQKAEGDLIVAERELRARKSPVYDACCYHCQQCAEKYLKAFLVSVKQNPPRIHNLVELLKLCLAHDKTFDLIRLDLELLTTYAVDIRYPGEVAIKEDARDAVHAARRVQQFVHPKL